jgi:hypothetical protein
MDVQGAEHEILTAATEMLTQKVKRIHVETHSQTLHADILKLFQGLTWKPHFIYAGNTRDNTPWRRIDFQSGIRSWLDPSCVATLS